MGQRLRVSEEEKKAVAHTGTGHVHINRDVQVYQYTPTHKTHKQQKVN